MKGIETCGLYQVKLLFDSVSNIVVSTPLTSTNQCLINKPEVSILFNKRLSVPNCLINREKFLTTKKENSLEKWFLLWKSCQPLVQFLEQYTENFVEEANITPRKFFLSKKHCTKLFCFLLNNCGRNQVHFSWGDFPAFVKGFSKEMKGASKIQRKGISLGKSGFVA